MTDKTLPEYDETVTCENPACVFVEATVMTGLYGIVGGGGIGPYTMCENCGVVLTKSSDPQGEIGDELTEIKTADVQGSADDKPRGDEG